MARKKKHGHEHADERWLLTYADMITLLMALFMVMFAMATVDKTKFNALKVSLHKSFSSAQILDGGSGVISSGAAASSQSTPGSELQGQDTAIPDAGNPRSGQASANSQALAKAVAAAASAEAKSLDETAEQVQKAIKAAGLAGKATVTIDPTGLRIRLVTDDVLFTSGSWDLRPASEPLLRHIARIIEPLPNPVRVEGYTDAVPYAGLPFGNLALSEFRSNAVLQFLEANGLSGSSHDAQPIGYGDRNPIDLHPAANGYSQRNRRVEIVLERRFSGSSTAPRTGALGQPIGAGPLTS